MRRGGSERSEEGGREGRRRKEGEGVRERGKREDGGDKGGREGGREEDEEGEEGVGVVAGDGDGTSPATAVDPSRLSARADPDTMRIVMIEIDLNPKHPQANLKSGVSPASISNFPSTLIHRVGKFSIAIPIAQSVIVPNNAD